MARKKIWAYAYKGENEYVWNPKIGKEKLYFIWEALKLRKDEPKEFKSLTFMSTQSNKNKRAELTAVKNAKSAFFRYNSDHINTRQPQDSDSELISHETAILVLSEMSEITFRDGDTVYKIEFDQIKKDDLKIRFEDESIYYPDLIGFFSKPEALAKKWGGKVAIEIKVTHPCSYQKIHDFHNHNIPIIEVYISDKLRLNAEIDNTNINESTMEDYYKFLQTRFSNFVFMKILSDPIMPAEHKALASVAHKKIINLQNEILRQQSLLSDKEKQNQSYILKIQNFEENLPKIKNLISNKVNENLSAMTKIDQQREAIKELQEQVAGLELKNYERLSFLERLKKLF